MMVEGKEKNNEGSTVSVIEHTYNDVEARMEGDREKNETIWRIKKSDATFNF